MRTLTPRLVAAAATASCLAALVAGPAGGAIGTATFCEHAPDGAGGFQDLGGVSPSARADIECLAASGITSGTGPGTYSPHGTVFRDTMATFVARLVDTANELELDDLAELPASGPDAFGDDGDSVHHANINRLAAAGVVAGKGGGSYGPNGPGNEVRRDQMATFLVNAIEFLLGDDLPAGTDAFADDDGSTHEASIDTLAAIDVVDGTSATTYDPSGTLSRAQMAAFLVRSLAYLEAEGAIAPLPGEDDGDDGEEPPGPPGPPAPTPPDEDPGPPVALDTELTVSAGEARADQGDVLQLCFDQHLANPRTDAFPLGDTEVVELVDVDGTRARLTQGVNASFLVGGDAMSPIAVGSPGSPTCAPTRTLEIVVNAEVEIVAAGSDAALQFPADIVLAAEIEDPSGAPFTPAGDPDVRVDQEPGSEPN